MPERILDFSEEAAHLSVRLSNLVIRRTDKPELTIPLSEIAVVIASHPGITCTHAMLAGLASNGAAFIACDHTRLPVGMMLPLQGHFTQSERIARQLAAKLPVRKRIWQQVVRTKIQAQAAALALAVGDDDGLIELARKVRSGDPDNIEAQAARRYWRHIFVDDAFRRDREAPDTNAVLNYGYTVLRGITSRAVCAVGLHPSLSLHHHNRYSQFTLADDLMEPFRPVVDLTAVAIRRARGPDVPVDKEAKAALLASLGRRFQYEGARRTLFDVLARVASSLVAVFEGERSDLSLPEFPEFLEIDDDGSGEDSTTAPR